MRRKMLFIDFETGGIDPEVHALVSLGAVVVNQGFIDDSYYTVINDPTGIITTEDDGDTLAARPIIGLTDEELRKGRNPGQVIEDLEQMLLKHDMRLPRRVLLGGHNVGFDIGFMKRLYRLAGADYNVRFERRYVDTMAAAYTLEQAGRIELEGAGSLVNTCRALKVPLVRSEVHNALDDVTSTAQCWGRMLWLMQHPQ